MSENSHSADNANVDELSALQERLRHVNDVLAIVDGELGEVQRPQPGVDLSFVIPVHDEEESIAELLERIQENIPRGQSLEVIFVDDGSRDDTWQVIQQLRDAHPHCVRGLRLRYNAGKATALAVGFRVSRGDIVFTMDGDLQDDPQEIPRFIAKLKEGYDLVSGWKKVRHDPWHKVLPSRVFNRLLSYSGNVRLHDHNCGFKCYRGELARKVNLRGELHRMVPCLAGMLGYRSAEIEIKHHPRTRGRSKYGIERFVRGFTDMLTIGFLNRYRYRPAHFFNFAGSAYMLVAIVMLGWAIVQPVSAAVSTMKVLSALLLGGMGVAVCLVGLVCELILRGPVKRRRSLPVAMDSGVPEVADKEKAVTRETPQLDPVIVDSPESHAYHIIS